MSWNYRIGTKLFSYSKEFEGKNEKLANHPDSRLFSIIEVYYDETGIPNGYTEPNPLANWESLDDLKGTLKLVELAFTKSIIDLDNFPNSWDKLQNDFKEITEEAHKKYINLVIKNTKSF